MRHIASKDAAGCLATKQHARQGHPEGFPGPRQPVSRPEAWFNPGDSVIVDPSGEIVRAAAREARHPLRRLRPGTLLSRERTLDVAVTMAGRHLPIEVNREARHRSSSLRIRRRAKTLLDPVENAELLAHVGSTVRGERPACNSFDQLVGVNFRPCL